jgi:CRISPR/Cas system CSM-associated protein Csm2 small subunit
MRLPMKAGLEGGKPMIASPKEWASLLGFDRDADERTMASRTRVLARTLAYLEDHFSDPDGVRPPEAVVVEFGQFLVLAEAMESKGRAAKFRELYETIAQLYLKWDEIDRDEAFQAIAKQMAVFKGIIAFSDAWSGSETPVPNRRGPVEAAPLFDAADVKTRIVRPGHLRS